MMAASNVSRNMMNSAGRLKYVMVPRFQVTQEKEKGLPGKLSRCRQAREPASRAAGATPQNGNRAGVRVPYDNAHSNVAAPCQPGFEPAERMGDSGRRF